MNNAKEMATCDTNNEDENSADKEHSSDPVQKGEERGCYPLEATKQEKGIIRRRSTQLLEGILH
jgi:hypothetical protein